MTITHKIVFVTGCVIVIVPTLLIGFCSFRIGQYRDGFSQIELGQSKEAVVNIMGKPSEVRNCSFSIYDRNENRTGDCSEIITYNGSYEQWAFAFDNDRNVIEKYYWFLGEYGNRPPGTN